MQLLVSWKDSLSLLYPKNFILFLLVTLKALVRTYKVWFTYWGWLFLINCLIYWLYGIGFVAWFHQFNDLTVHSLVGFIFILPIFEQEIIPTLSYVFLLFTLYLSVRASVVFKNYDYFGDYVKHAFYFVCWFFLARIFVVLLYSNIFLHYIGNYIFNILQLPHNIMYLLLIIPVFFVSIVTLSVSVCMPVFFIFFLLDSDARVLSVFYALGRSLKMAIYNAPLCSALVMFLLGLGAIISTLVSCGLYFWGASLYVQYAVMGMFYLAMLPVPLCFLTNLYNKILYDRFVWYLG